MGLQKNNLSLEINQSSSLTVSEKTGNRQACVCEKCHSFPLCQRLSLPSLICRCYLRWFSCWQQLAYNFQNNNADMTNNNLNADDMSLPMSGKLRGSATSYHVDADMNGEYRYNFVMRRR